MELCGCTIVWRNDERFSLCFSLWLYASVVIELRSYHGGTEKFSRRPGLLDNFSCLQIKRASWRDPVIPTATVFLVIVYRNPTFSDYFETIAGYNQSSFTLEAAVGM